MKVIEIDDVEYYDANQMVKICSHIHYDAKTIIAKMEGDNQSYTFVEYDENLWKDREESYVSELQNLLIPVDYVDNILLEKTLKVTKYDEIIKIFKSDSSLSNVINDIVGRGEKTRMCRWGSYSYAFAQDVHDLLFYLSDVCGLNDTAIFKLFKISIVDITNDDENMIESLKVHLFRENRLRRDEDYDGDKKDIKKAKNIDEIFVYLKKIGWDLWKATDFVFKIIYPAAKLKVYANSKVKKDTTFDDKDAVITGFKCWILRKDKFVSNDDSFTRFST